MTFATQAFLSDTLRAAFFVSYFLFCGLALFVIVTNFRVHQSWARERGPQQRSGLLPKHVCVIALGTWLLATAYFLAVFTRVGSVAARPELLGMAVLGMALIDLALLIIFRMYGGRGQPRRRVENRGH